MKAIDARDVKRGDRIRLPCDGAVGTVVSAYKTTRNGAAAVFVEIRLPGGLWENYLMPDDVVWRDDG